MFISNLDDAVQLADLSWFYRKIVMSLLKIIQKNTDFYHNIKIVKISQVRNVIVFKYYPKYYESCLNLLL